MKRYQIVMSALLVVPLLACAQHGPNAVENSEVEDVPQKTPGTEPAAEPTKEATPAAAPADSPAATATATAAWSVRYTDGSNNAFHFWKEAAGDTRFQYAPMKPELSSSGTYSGGSAKEGSVPEAQAKDLWSRVTTLEADPRLHAKARSMGTGSFKITSGDKGERSFIVAMGPALEEFNALLKSYR
jgi:hypothetical protein